MVMVMVMVRMTGERWGGRARTMEPAAGTVAAAMLTQHFGTRTSSKAPRQGISTTSSPTTINDDERKRRADPQTHPRCRGALGCLYFV